MKTEDFLKLEINRRQFLGSSAANAAGMAAGMVAVGMADAGTRSASNRVRVGVVGVRTQGLSLAETFAGFPDVDVAALCDVDEQVLVTAANSVAGKQSRQPKSYRDFRRLLDDDTIDAVAIATPDHWHAVMAVRALQAGKDVYLETPVTHRLEEGPRIIEAAKKHKRVVQCGLQQRSGRHFLSAIDYIRRGELGSVRLARAWCAHRRKPIGIKADTPAPAGVDYNLWLGPAALRPFNPNRFHHNWHWYWDYGTGEIGNWGVHFLDVARWGLNVALPTRVASTGGIHYLKDDRETPDTQVVQYSFPEKTIIWEHRMWSMHGLEGRSAACAFYGDNGTLIIDRGGWKVYGRKDAAASGPSEMLPNHCREFIACVKSRRNPTADAECGHISSALCHLGNLAHRLGREVEVEQKAGMPVVNDTEFSPAPYREPWTI